MPQSQLRFVSPAPATDGDPVPFDVVMRDKKTGREVEQSFQAQPPGTVSFGQLLDLTSLPELQMVLATFEKVLVADNTAAADGDDDRSEYQRLRDFLLDPDLYIHQSTLLEMVQGLVELYAERPTVPPLRSAPTPRPGPRGATGKRPKRPVR